MARVVGMYYYNIKRNMSRLPFIDRNVNERRRKAAGEGAVRKDPISIIIIYTCAINSGGL